MSQMNGIIQRSYICNVFLRRLVQVHRLGVTQKISDRSSDSEIVNAVQCTSEDGVIVWDKA